MEINWSVSGIGFEVGSLAAETKTASSLSMLSFFFLFGFWGHSYGSGRSSDEAMAL